MELPGRTYITGKGYRYSINGQEKTPEIAANTTTAEFWQYDARIVRRWNTDPKPISGLSVYAVFANNPIFNSDVRGDTLSIGTNQATKDDINSLVSMQNQGFINLPAPGRMDVTLNESIKVGNETLLLKDAMRKDKGLKLLYDLISDTKNYFYSVTLRRIANATDLSTGTSTALDDDLSTDPNFAVGNRITETTPATGGSGGIAYYQTFENLSFTLRGDEATALSNIQVTPNKEVVIGYVTPSYKRKYDGVIRIAPGEFQQQITSASGTKINLIRSKIVYHELRENYYRVNGMSYDQAHNQSIADYTGGALYGNGKASDDLNVSSGAGISTNRRLGEAYFFIRK